MSDRVIRYGKVSSVDYESGMIKVTYPDLDDAVSDDLPMLTSGTEYHMPKPGDNVVTLHMPNGMDGGFCLGSVWNKDHASALTGANKFRKELADTPGEAYLEYDGDKLTIHASSIEIKADSITIDGSVVDIGSAGTITGLKVDGCSGCGG